jgi:predicted nucleic acid-binding protein
MVATISEGSTLLLDACCIINLFATGRAEEILAALPYEFATSRLIVDKEVISITCSPKSTDLLDREVIHPSRLESLPNLAIVDFSGDAELDLFIHFAAHLDDGEASVCALALARGGALATDDRKAIRLLAGTRPEIKVVQTPELLYQWAQLLRIRDQEVREVLQAVEQNARFRPRRDAPHSDWWERLRA